MIRSSHNLRTKSNSSRVHPTNPPLENFPKKWTWNPGERYSWMEWTCENQVVMSNARTGLHKTLQCSAWTTILGWDRTTISKASAWGFTLSFLPGELPSVGMTDLIREIMHTLRPKGSPQLVATLHVVQKLPLYFKVEHLCRAVYTSEIPYISIEQRLDFIWDHSLTLLLHLSLTCNLPCKFAPESLSGVLFLQKLILRH